MSLFALELARTRSLTCGAQHSPSGANGRVDLGGTVGVFLAFPGITQKMTVIKKACTMNDISIKTDISA